MFISITKHNEIIEILQAELEQSYARNKELLDRILLLTQPTNNALAETINNEKIVKQRGVGGIRTLSSMRRAMETESRHQAQLLAKQKIELTETPVDNSIEELEKELGVDDAPVQ